MRRCWTLMGGWCMFEFGESRERSSVFSSLTLHNYKGFESAILPIRPLTFLLGKNSSGKSSIVQLILALFQTQISRKKHPTQFINNGKFVTFGKSENLWRLKDKTKDLVLSFDISNNKDLITLLKDSKRKFVTESFHRLSYYNSSFDRYFDKDSKDTSIKKLKEILDESAQKFRDQRDKNIDSTLRENIFDPIAAIEDQVRVITKTASRGRLTKSLANSPIFHFASLHEQSAQELEDTLNFLTGISSISESNGLTLRYKLAVGYGDQVFVDEMELRCGSKRILSAKLDWKSESVKSPITNLHTDFSDVNIGRYASAVRVDSFEGFSNTLSRQHFDSFRLTSFSGFPEFVNLLLSAAHNAAFDRFCLGTMQHVPPLRAHPRRHYLIDLISSTVDEQVFQHLENKSTRKSINDWLANFGVSITIGDIEEVIKKIVIRPTRLQDLSLEIADVGFGFSQIIPMLAAILSSPKNAVILIEQPEVHLHPDMQAACGDLFSRLIDKEKSDSQRCFIIETHSEYLLTEVRANVAKGLVDSRDISILFFETDDDGSNRISSADIDRKGAVDWPSAFIERHHFNQETLIQRQLSK